MRSGKVVLQGQSQYSARKGIMLRTGAFAGRFVALGFLVFLLTCCGYELVREKGVFGGAITSLSVPVFKNTTFEPHVPSYLTESFNRELMSTGLFKINQSDTDGYVEGVIKAIRVLPFSLSKDGLVAEKSVAMDLELALFRKNGALLKRWTLSDTETYRVDNVNYEDYNKRDALKRISARMARKFVSVILVDY